LFKNKIAALRPLRLKFQTYLKNEISSNIKRESLKPALEHKT